MAKRRRSYGKILLIVVVVLGIAIAYRQSLIPAALNPLPTLNLDHPRGWTGGLLIDWQLASIKRSRRLCKKVLNSPLISYAPIRDRVGPKGCGWKNAVRTSRIAGARVSVNPLTCQVAAALTLWMAHDVQVLAQEYFGTRVRSLETMGTYSCRNIIGNKRWANLPSQHSFANAIDISGFVLADGRRISVRRHWRGKRKRAAFLRAVHSRACRYFRVALGPDFNPAHADHFHFDRGSLWTCK